MINLTKYCNLSMDTARLIKLPKIEDERGNLSFIESGKHIPFKIKKVHWIYDIPGGVERHGHAYKTMEEYIIAISGSYDVVIYENGKEKVFHLNKPNEGIYIPPKTWRKVQNFSTNAVCLIITSDFYNESDYIRDFSDFLEIMKKEHDNR